MKHIRITTKMKVRRISLGITQEYIAGKLDMAISSVGGIERGTNTAKKEIADKIAEILKTTTLNIFKPVKNKFIAK